MDKRQAERQAERCRQRRQTKRQADNTDKVKEGESDETRGRADRPC